MKLSELKLEEHSDGHVYLEINEILKRKFDDLEWKRVGTTDVGSGTIDGIPIELVLDPKTYYGARWINVVFRTLNSAGEFSEKAGAVKAGIQQASAIIGAVSNAVIDRLKTYDWELVTLIAKDNIETRMKLYQHIARRVQVSKFDEELVTHHGMYDGQGVVAIAKKGSSSLFKKFDEDNGVHQ
jgi:hypothetical protein